MIGPRLKKTALGALLALGVVGLAPAAAQADFGILPGSFSLTAKEEGGAADQRAGSHPYEVVTSFALNRTTLSNRAEVPADAVRDIVVETPAGLLGDPSATSQCTRAQLASSPVGGCPANAEVGEETLAYLSSGKEATFKTGVYNMVAPAGAPAQFAFKVLTTTVYITASVRTGGDYGITFDIAKVAQTLPLVGSTLTFWGVPATHNKSGEPPRPFITMPSVCGVQGQAVLRVDSWQRPGAVNALGLPEAGGAGWSAEAISEPALSGCEELQMQPALHASLDGGGADSPTGLHLSLEVPQTDAASLPATPAIQDATVTLPAGVTINPGGAAGRVGCPLTGAEGVNLSSPQPAGCPSASKIGTVDIQTPLLKESMTGGIYLAQQGNLPGLGANPFGSLLAVYIAAEGSGVVLKLAGEVTADPVSGQVTATFEENPQLPFSDLKIDFFGGPRAALSTPAACGSYVSSAAITPYSSAQAVSVKSQPFTISSGCNGGFSPALSAGTVNPQAGAFSPFTMTLSRRDGEQALSTVSLTLPPGLAGTISKVPLCGEAQANAGGCPAASRIGHVTVQAGVGDQPIALPEAGRPQDPVFLTGPYEGAPFGLSIVVPAQAGPFDLGTVVVRAKIEVNPTTAQVSVKSNPLQSILQGVPLDVQSIDVTIDREGFTFNPTSCRPMSVNGVIGSQEGASHAVSARFQAADCATLPFKPSFTATVHQHHTKANGEYLHVTVRSGEGKANLARIHVTLPKKLPSRLSTLKLACPAAQFAKDPAGCPEGSFVGTVTVHTPVLAVPLSGPALFVSHGGAGFPNLDFVLQGDGVSIDLVGDTFISKAGITTSTFSAVPDVPISRVDVNLPTGPHSALGGNGDLCAAPLHMPTTITAQNGAVFSQRTRIDVAGCKPSIGVLGKRAGHGAASVSVRVPAAGRLIASGRGIARKARTLRGAGTTKIEVKLSPGARRLLARHPGRRLDVTVHLRFQPRNGRAITAKTRVLIG